MRAAIVPLISLVAVTITIAHGCRSRSSPAPAGSPDASAGAMASTPLPADGATIPGGTLAFEVLDRATTQPIPCKLTFVGVGGTPRPRFADGEVPASIEGGIAVYSRVLSLAGRGSLRVPDGSYDVWVSHGPEWSVHVERGVRIGGQGAKLRALLSHEVPTPGWLSADLHVHADPSWDSKVPLGARVHEFAAEAVDVLVATDHNVVTDYTPELAELDADKLLSSVVGVELSTVDWGHFGAFPVVRDDDWWVLHGIRMKGIAAADLLRGTRQRHPGALISVNHPRLGKMGYFNRADYNPLSGRTSKPRSSLDFDAVEIMNGYKDAGRDQVERVMRDWFGLLLHGRRVVAVGNSDTHHLRYSVAGYPRNYVQVRSDAIGATGATELAEGLRQGRSFFTTGPVLELDVDGTGIGGVVPAKGKSVKLRVRVRAAGWVDVTRVTVLLDGKKAHAWDVAPSSEPERFRGEHSLAVDKDAFLVVRVDGDRTLEPVVGGSGIKPVPSLALSNPIYLDADGNGKYDAPGR